MKNSLLAALALAMLANFGAARNATAQEAPLQYRTDWVGNTFGGGAKWVQNFAQYLRVMPDGTCIVGSDWDEAGREVGFYRDGEVKGKLEETHGRGGGAVAANDRYVFYTQHSMREDQPQVKAGESRSDKPITFAGVGRWTRDGKFAPFDGGKTRFKNLLALSEAPYNRALVPGDIVATNRELWVADTNANRVRVYDAETLAPIRDFAAPNPHRLALDSNGDLWVLQTGGRQIARYSPQGQPRAVNIQLPADALASALSFAPDGRLIVPDGGPRQQILFFDVRSGALVGTFGERGGMFGGDNPGRVAPGRLVNPTGAGFDAAGNFYVACNLPTRGTVLRAFAPGSPGKTRPMKWQLLGIEFVGVADAVPGSDGRQILSNHNAYSYDPDGAAGKNWEWRSYLVDPFRYPDDLRWRQNVLQCATSIRVLDGQTFLCQRGMWQSSLGFYRVEGDVAVPSLVLAAGPLKQAAKDNPVGVEWRAQGQPEKGRFFWRDLNGNGGFDAGEYAPTPGPEGEFWASSVDERGDIWQAAQEAGIWRWKYRGLDAHKNPIYDPNPQHYPMPAPLTNLLRTHYEPATDTMFLSGQTADRPMTGREWGTAGTVLLRYDGWSGEPKLVYRADLPYVAGKTFMISMDIAGDLCFFGDSRSAHIRVYAKSDGRFLGEMRPGPEVSGESGWLDIRDALRARRLNDGNYMIIVEEDAKAKNLVYRLQDPLRANPLRAQ